MRQKRRLATLYTQRHVVDPELCTCIPLFLLNGSVVPQAGDPTEQKEDARDYDQWVLAPPSLKERLHTALAERFPRSQPLSVLLLHVSQMEQVYLSTASTSLYKRRRYHAPSGLLEQILINVKRVIRVDDEALLHDDVGAALILPDVDQQGAHLILERVYHSIGLLQAETVVPPLTRETTITLGIGTYPDAGHSLDMLLYRVGLIARRLILRPAITAELLAMKPIPRKEIVQSWHGSDIQQSGNDYPSVPFMELPKLLPKRLTHLIPYNLALKLGCAPVGRDHQYLTVAMVNPLNTESVHLLEEVTGLTIFPVSCQEEDLNALLAHAW